MKKEPSMMSLRNRRDPQFHGIRTIKPARVVNKAGDRNVHAKNLPEKSYRFIKDLVHTLVETQWRYVLLFFAFAFFGSWLSFALIYWIIAWANGDLEFDDNGQRVPHGHIPCIVEAKSFAGFFLFSVESQVSTGYGTWLVLLIPKFIFDKIICRTMIFSYLCHQGIQLSNVLKLFLY